MSNYQNVETKVTNHIISSNIDDLHSLTHKKNVEHFAYIKEKNHSKRTEVFDMIRDLLEYVEDANFDDRDFRKKHEATSYSELTKFQASAQNIENANDFFNEAQEELNIAINSFHFETRK